MDMQTEFEAKFCDVDFAKVRQQLQALGATQTQPMRLMRRQIIDFDDGRLQSENSFVRLRDEGDKISLTFKHFPGAMAVDGAKEIEITVSEFDKTSELLSAVGLQATSYQESRRETWVLDDVEIVLDEWPWLKPYIEVEAGSEDRVRELAEKLGFDWSEAVFGSVTEAYALEYDFDPKLMRHGDVRFDQSPPSWLKPKSS